MIYDPSSTLRDARQIYFEANDFGNGGYDDRWVKLKAGPFAIWFPNTAARKRAVKFHDLHHVLTEYQTTWTGEAEIGAWEVASNCRDHYAAWILNLAAFGLGLFIAPAAVFQAFLRGRRTRNLYDRDSIDPFLDRTVRDVRKELDLVEGPERTPAPLSSTSQDKAAFAVWGGAALIVAFGPLLAGAMVLKRAARWLRR